MNKIKIIFLGTNGWYDSDTGSTICTLIDAKDHYILLDAGNGIYKADKYIDKKKPVYLFLSHFHIDHIEGLHILEKFSDTFKSLKIFGQPGTARIIDYFLGDKFSIPLSRLRFKTKIIELKQGFHKVPFNVQCLKLLHSSTCYGYRLEIGDKVISYCTDTGYCANAIKLAKNADLLISECSFKSGQVNSDWPHLNPELAARLAKEAAVKQMYLTHFDANIYKSIKMRAQAKISSKRIFNNTVAAKDMMMVCL